MGVSPEEVKADGNQYVVFEAVSKPVPTSHGCSLMKVHVLRKMVILNIDFDKQTFRYRILEYLVIRFIIEWLVSGTGTL